MRLPCLLAAKLLLAALAGAQEFPATKEFLTDYEIDVLRERQGFKDRIAAYSKFAALRLELIEQAREAEEAGRGAKVHRALEEYARIIQAVDDVIDDALLRNRRMDGALADLLKAEGQFAARLRAVASVPQEDTWRYEFALEDAIGITQDSMDLLAEDLGDRKRAVAAQEETEKRRRLESMAPERRKEARQEQRREEAATAERERKRPTLLRPGEKAGAK